MIEVFLHVDCIANCLDFISVCIANCLALVCQCANNLLLRLLDSFDPYHLLDGPPVIFRHVEVYDHVALLVVLMTVAHLALDGLERLLQMLERKRGVGIGQEVEKTVGLDADGRRPNRFSKDDSGKQMAQPRLCFVDVLLL